MCGRYVIARSVDDLLFDVDAVPGEPLRDVPSGEARANWNVAPTSDVPILLERFDADGAAPRRELHVARWGLIPGWAKEASIGTRAFNARSETVVDKPMFRSAIRHRRCAVPANGYYEWKKRLDADGQPVKATKERPAKQPYYVHPENPEENIWFAGIYEWWQESDGTWVLSCSILTTEAPPTDSDRASLAELGALHDRLPIALTRDTLGQWLDPTLGAGKGAQAKEAVLELVARIRHQALDAAGTWQLHAVDSAVGNVRNNTPELIEPIQALF